MVRPIDLTQCVRRPLTFGRIGFAFLAFRPARMNYCPIMQMWIQIKDHDEDVQFSDSATYEVHTSGVLMVTSGDDIHLYSPAYWQGVTIDTRSADQREKQAQAVDEDLKWQ